MVPLAPRKAAARYKRNHWSLMSCCGWRPSFDKWERCDRISDPFTRGAVSLWNENCIVTSQGVRELALLQQRHAVAAHVAEAHKRLQEQQNLAGHQVISFSLSARQVDQRPRSR